MAQPQKEPLRALSEQAEAAGIVQLNEDEAGPYQAIPQPGAKSQPEGHPAVQPHEQNSPRSRAPCLCALGDSDAALHASGRLVAEYGQIGAAHHRPSSTLRSAR